MNDAAPHIKSGCHEETSSSSAFSNGRGETHKSSLLTLRVEYLRCITPFAARLPLRYVLS
jgi:hypothetical protein